MPIGAMAVREMKMIPGEVGGIGLALLGLRIGIEVCDSHGVGVQFPQRNVFFSVDCKRSVHSYICSWFLPPVNDNSRITNL